MLVQQNHLIIQHGPSFFSSSCSVWNRLLKLHLVYTKLFYITVVQCSLYDCSTWLTLKTRGKLCSDGSKQGLIKPSVFSVLACVFVCLCMLISLSYLKTETVGITSVYTVRQTLCPNKHMHTCTLKTIQSIKHRVKLTLYVNCRVKLLSAHVWDWVFMCKCVLAHVCDNFHCLKDGRKYCLSVFLIG